MSQAQSVLVTGATGGIGEAISLRFAAAGWRVAVGYRSDAERARALVDSLGRGAVALYCPVDESTALENAAARLDSGFGGLDCIVNNAGFTQFVPHDDLDGLSDELFLKILDTNVRGPFAVIRAFRKLLERRNCSSIINLSSIAAITGLGSNVAYCASKAALDSMTRSLARALAPDIRVLSVSPGVVDTDFIQGRDERWRDAQLRATPMKRFAKKEDVAEACFVGATGLTFSTGTVVSVDGGRPLGPKT